MCLSRFGNRNMILFCSELLGYLFCQPKLRNCQWQPGLSEFRNVLLRDLWLFAHPSSTYWRHGLSPSWDWPAFMHVALCVVHYFILQSVSLPNYFGLLLGLSWYFEVIFISSSWLCVCLMVFIYLFVCYQSHLLRDLWLFAHPPSTSVVHNVRPAGHIWPASSPHVARDVQQGK